MRSLSIDEDGRYYTWRYQTERLLFHRWISRRTSVRSDESYGSAGVSLHLGKSGGRQVVVSLERDEYGQLVLYVSNMRGIFAKVRI